MLFYKIVTSIRSCPSLRDSAASKKGGRLVETPALHRHRDLQVGPTTLEEPNCLRQNRRAVSAVYGSVSSGVQRILQYLYTSEIE